MTSMDQTFGQMKQNCQKLKEQSAHLRIQKLLTLKKALKSYREKFYQALRDDLRRHPQETEINELLPLRDEIGFTSHHLKRWMKPKRVKNPLYFWGSRGYLHYEPKGVTLIIGPWNYPLLLTLHPLISAIAAGNPVVVKPSELSPNTSSVLSELITSTFDPNEIRALQGGVEASQRLLALPFDHIFFTGSTRIGHLVMESAAKNLTPVTLELGGKSPVIIDTSAPLSDAAMKIAWGKFVNAGQTCVAPDYILIHESQLRNFVDLLKLHIGHFYKNQFQKSQEYCKIINESHFQRLKGLVEASLTRGARLEFGGEFFPAEQVISPTVLTQVENSHPIMQEEIFGPILPIIPYRNHSEALGFVRSMTKPLALYIFSQDPQATKLLLEGTSSGGVCINNVTIHLGHHGLPFGGIGGSGMGNYHGHFGFKTFSHERAVLHSQRFNLLKLIYPPYRSMLRWVQKM